MPLPPRNFLRTSMGMGFDSISPVVRLIIATFLFNAMLLFLLLRHFLCHGLFSQPLARLPHGPAYSRETCLYPCNAPLGAALRAFNRSLAWLGRKPGCAAWIETSELTIRPGLRNSFLCR